MSAACRKLQDCRSLSDKGGGDLYEGQERRETEAETY